MNGWNGFNLPMGVSATPFRGFGGSVGLPNISTNGYSVPSPPPAPYMTPAGGSEYLASIPPIAGSYGTLNTRVDSAMPGTGGSGGWFGVDGLGKNLGTLQLGIGTLAAGANIWNSLQQNKLAKASFNHQKGLLDTNLANQIKSFNLQLDDKLRSRQVVEGTSDASREEARKKWEARDERRG